MVHFIPDVFHIIVYTKKSLWDSVFNKVALRFIKIKVHSQGHPMEALKIIQDPGDPNDIDKSFFFHFKTRRCVFNICILHGQIF